MWDETDRSVGFNKPQQRTLLETHDPHTEGLSTTH